MLPIGSLCVIFTLVFTAQFSSALGACRGNGCPIEEAAARAAGLLGDSLKGACIPQQYPKQGALLPVRAATRNANFPVSPL